MTFPFKSRLQTIEQIAFPESRVSLFELGYIAPFETNLPAAETADESSEAETATDANAPPIVSPPVRDMRALVSELLAPMWAHLDSLEISKDDQELVQRRSDLLGKLRELGDTLGTFLSDHRQKLVGTLTAEWESAASACRAQREVVKTTQQKVDEYQAEIRKANAALSQARGKLNSTLEREPRLGQWPTAGERHRWIQQRDAAQAALTAADKAQTDVFQRDRELRRKLAEANQKLSELAKAEAVLRARLSGSPWTDPEYNLVHPAEL